MLAPISPLHLRIVMILVTTAYFMEILDGTVIVTALPSMAHDFGTSAIALSAGVSVYLLALGVFVPASGWVADRFGTRWTFASAMVLFTAASALCGLVSEMPVFIALRFLQGLAGAMMVPIGRLLVMRFTPKDHLMAALSSLVWPALLGPVIGPPLGGLITQNFGWRWIFYLNVPVGIIAFVLILLFVPDVRGERRRFDWIGFALCGLGTFALLGGLERMADRFDGVSGLLLIGGALILLLAVRHLRRALVPMIDLAACAIPTFRVSLIGGSLFRIAITATAFLLPVMFQTGFGYDPFHAGLLVLALFAGNISMKTVTTPFLRRFGYRPTLIGNGLFCAASLACCALLSPTTPPLLTACIVFLGGCSRSLQFTSFATVAFADVNQSMMSDANSLYNAISQVSAAAGIAAGALCVNASQLFVAHFDVTSPGADYRGSFILLGLIALAGLTDSILLPRNAGDHFISRQNGGA